MNRKIDTRSQNMYLPQVGDGRRGSEATKRGQGVGGGIPLLDQGVFALWGFKLSDLVHTLGKFVGILSIQTRSKSRSLLESGGWPMTERSDRTG